MRDSGESCLECGEGFQLSTTKVNECVEIGEKGEGCHGVDDEGKCDYCVYGYYAGSLHLEDLKCVKTGKYTVGVGRVGVTFWVFFFSVGFFTNVTF